MGPQVLPGACSGVGSPWGHSFLQASPCSSVGSIPWAAGGDLLHRGPPWAAGAQPASPWSSSRAAREESLLRHLEHLLPLLHQPWYLQSFLSHRLTAVPPRGFSLPFLKYVIPEALPPAPSGLALGSCGSVSEPAGTGSVRPGGSFSQQPPLQPPATQTLPRRPRRRAKPLLGAAAARVLRCAAAGPSAWCVGMSASS